MMVGIDGTPAIRQLATGTEVYARSIIEALAGSRGPRRMRVYANAVEAPPWLPAGVEWRGIPFPRAWSHWRLRQGVPRGGAGGGFFPPPVFPPAPRFETVGALHHIRAPPGAPAHPRPPRPHPPGNP